MRIAASYGLTLATTLVLASPAEAQTLADLLEQAEAMEAAATPPATVKPVPPQRPAADQKPPPTAAADRRLPTPRGNEANASIARVQAVFQEKYAGPLKDADKAALCGELLALLESTQTPADRWALMTEALRLASEAGDVASATATTSKLAAEFQISLLEVKFGSLKELAANTPPASLSSLATECLTLARLAIDAGDFECATKSVALAKAAARRGKNNDLAAVANRIAVAIKDREKVAKRMESLREELAQSPDDPALNAEVGLILCLQENKWPQGLPKLLKAEDPALRKLAQLEINGAVNLRERVAVGNAWWAWAETQKAPFNDAGRQRALGYYNEALEEAQGLERAMLEKRIASISQAGPGSGEAIALASLQETDTAEVYGGVTKDGTFNGVPYTCGGVKHPKAIYTAPKSQGTAMIAFRPPPGSRRLRGTTGVFSVAGKENEQPGSAMVMEIVVDGKTVWQSPKLAQREQTAKFDVALDNAARVELRTRATGNNASCWGAWLDPVFVK